MGKGSGSVKMGGIDDSGGWSDGGFFGEIEIVIRVCVWKSFSVDLCGTLVIYFGFDVCVSISFVFSCLNQVMSFACAAFCGGVGDDDDVGAHGGRRKQWSLRHRKDFPVIYRASYPLDLCEIVLQALPYVRCFHPRLISVSCASGGPNALV